VRSTNTGILELVKFEILSYPFGRFFFRAVVLRLVVVWMRFTFISPGMEQAGDSTRGCGCNYCVDKPCSCSKRPAAEELADSDAVRR